MPAISLRPEVLHIETRLLVAYGLIFLMVLTGIGLTLFIRHNSHTVSVERNQKRDRAKREAKLLKK